MELIFNRDTDDDPREKFLELIENAKNNKFFWFIIAHTLDENIYLVTEILQTLKNKIILDLPTVPEFHGVLYSKFANIGLDLYVLFGPHIKNDLFLKYTELEGKKEKIYFVEKIHIFPKENIHAVLLPKYTLIIYPTLESYLEFEQPEFENIILAKIWNPMIPENWINGWEFRTVKKLRHMANRLIINLFEGKHVSKNKDTFSVLYKKYLKGEDLGEIPNNLFLERPNIIFKKVTHHLYKNLVDDLYTPNEPIILLKK